jgi:hypothetical protein
MDYAGRDLAIDESLTYGYAALGAFLQNPHPAKFAGIHTRPTPLDVAWRRYEVADVAVR